ncbi:GSCFA domain-containing protein [Rhizobium sp. ARZ01]|uniref:GSCFA domain-containing protein n=1 Tax=Rhizobium sp. ARZ01 TaxID=2769313 RepID=UPI00177D2F34|nr:GSCFA domain-containing protein [Rhizobium sp. ARZ01]MBD9373985.1 GSCFA domain-containing protein [Rhizobium sp. ARZ01]
MSFSKISFKEAQKLTRGNKFPYFAKIGDGRGGAERIEMDFPSIHVDPKFQLEKSDVFFTIGSCFARNLERELSKIDVTNLTSNCVFDGDLYGMRGSARNGALNAYTPKSMLDLLRLHKRSDAMTAGIIQTGDNEFFDMMTSGLRALTADESEAVRSKLLETYRSLKDADVVVVTLGFTETWVDEQDNIHINRSPGGEKKLVRSTERYAFFNESPASTMETVEAIVHEIKEQTGGRAKVVITTSPVPLHRTWLSRDIVSANLYSKSTLLSAATHAAAQYDFVDYFPSYEMVTFSPRSIAWKEDGMHVHPEVVEKIIRRFSDLYFASKLAD